MKKILLFTSMFLNRFNAQSQEKVALSIPIISLQTDAAIIQDKVKPFQLSKEYYELFEELGIKKTIQVKNLLKSNSIFPKDKVFYPLFNQKVLLELAKQVIPSLQTDIVCAKRKLSDFANLFVGDTNNMGVFVPCTNKSAELRAQIAVLNSVYSRFYQYQPVDSPIFRSKIDTRKKLKFSKITTNPCLATHDFRYDMNFDLLNSQSGGNGNSAGITLVENGYINPTTSNLTRAFPNTTNPKLHDTTLFRIIALSTPTPDYSHAQKDISILFDSFPTGIDGIAKQSNINKIFFFDNNCMGNMIYTEFEALLEAIVATPRNGVLLLEFGATDKSFPAEKEPILFELIQFATKYKNIIVIEPAGNGGSDIAGLAYTPNPKRVPKRICPVINDSGAIIVGGSETTSITNISGTYRRVANNRCGISNFGNRIDCFAQGELVHTGNGNHNSSSAASAIIAGLAVDIQSISKAKYGRFLTPLQMRYLLSLPSSIKVKQGSLLNDKYIPVVSESFLISLDRLFSDCPPNCPLEK